jgi:DNA repair photolyase
MQLATALPASAPTSRAHPRMPSQAARGRGAIANPANRFESQVLEPFDDGWDTLEGLADLPKLATTLTKDASKSAISWNNSPDLGFDRAVNPYRGCEHGCIYCFARPSHAYLGYSPGLDFETRLVFKPDVASLLEKELSKPNYVVKPMGLGTNTDPYQPIDRTLKLTRSVLEVLERFSHPVGIVTKSAGVLRDADILARMAKRNLAKVHISITTLDPALARALEPRAASPQRRLAAVRELREAGIPVGVMASPMIPGVNDAELESILEESAKAGAQSAHTTLLRLPHELSGLFSDWLQKHLPDRASHVLSLIRQSRGGRLNDPDFHSRFTGSGPYVDMLQKRFERATRQFGLEGGASTLDCSQFAVPSQRQASAQMNLF